MSQTADNIFSVTRQAEDPRADGGMRVVHVSRRQIVIERVIQGVRMKVAVPVAAYRGVILSVRLQSATATLFLRHEDQELDIALDSGDAIKLAHEAKAWGALFGKPISIEEACIAIRQPFARSAIGRRHPAARSSRGGESRA